jgi:topoisomerase IA-like protein
MSIDSILSEIDAEIATLTQVRSLLASTGKAATKVTARKAKKTPAKAKTRKRRVLSPEARKRIADAQRKRWAAQKAKA